MRYLAITLLISTLVAVGCGIMLVDAMATRDAKVAVLEREASNLRVLLEDCQEQLGVFYRPPTRKEGKNGHGS